MRRLHRLRRTREVEQHKGSTAGRTGESNVRFSIGRFGSSAFRQSIASVSMSLTGSRFSSEWHQGPSIMGFENEAEQSFGRPCHQNDGGSKRTCDLTSFVVPQGTSFHRAVETRVFSCLMLCGCHAAAASSRVQRNSVPSTHMRCMITASRRASATIAFFIPRCRAIFIAQALSQDHRVERISRIWAAS